MIDDLICRTCVNYKGSIAERDNEICNLKTQLFNNQETWKKIVESKNEIIKKIIEENKYLKKELNTKIVKELKKLQKETNSEATEEGYVDAVWFDRLIDIEIKKLEVE